MANKTKTKPTFVPGKNYSWQPEDEFIFTGTELGALNHVITEFILGQSTSVGTILKIGELHTLIQNKIAQYVEKGVIVEIEEPTKVN